jgi:hypothetical protein
MSDTLRQCLDAAAEEHQQVRCPVDLAKAMNEAAPRSTPWFQITAAAALLAMGVMIGLVAAPKATSTPKPDQAVAAPAPTPKRTTPTFTLASSLSVPKFQASTTPRQTKRPRRFMPRLPSMPKLRTPRVPTPP